MSVWAWLGIIAVLLAGVAAVAYRFRGSRGGLPIHPEDMMEEPGGRLAVLESTVVDANRRLLLVRRDDVEHLILVGGPADLVVETDVQKNRSAPRSALRAPAPETAIRSFAAADRADSALSPAGGEAALRADAKAPLPKPAEPADQLARAPASNRPALAAVPVLAAVPPPLPSIRNGAAPAPGAGPASRSSNDDKPRRVEPQVRPGAAAKSASDNAGDKPRPQAVEPQFGRREPGSVAPRGVVQPALAGAQPSIGTGSGSEAAPRREPPPGLPTAEVPWPEPDSIENEIVRALSAVRPAPDAAAASLASQPSTATAESTTLGDLADRLEEALAKEMRDAGDSRARLDLNLDAFGFAAPPPKSPAAPSRDQRQDPKEPPRLAAAPQAEPRRESRPAPERQAERKPEPQPERQEDAPVISLNARRREAVDPLEDEMARLLGELTGDTKGR